MTDPKDTTEAAGFSEKRRNPEVTLARASGLVLVVEGDPEMNRFICESLHPEHRVAMALDGNEGLRSALELRPDVILTALALPGLGGDELVHAIRSRRDLDRTPIVLLATPADQALRVRLLDDGAQDYLVKPFAVDALRARVDSLIFGKRAREAEARLVSLVEQAPDGIFVADLDGRYTEVNEAGCRMLGYSREEIVGKTIVDLISPEDVERLMRSREYMLEGRTHVAEWTLRRKDGKRLPVEVSARILPDGRWQGFVRDISERLRARDRLRQSQERFELALRGADLAAWDWNMQSGEVIFNSRWAEMRGLSPDEIEPHVDSWVSGVHPEDWPRVQQALDDYVQGRTAEYQSEHRVRTKSGEWIWILDRGKVFARDERGQPLRMVGTELDITSRKRAEEDLRVAEAKSSGILSISADAIIAIDAQQRITMFNEGAESIFGYSKAEALGTPLGMLIPERFRDEHQGHVERFVVGPVGSRRMGEAGASIFGLRKNGEEFPADAVISKLEVGGRQILVVALRDITLQKRVEREQRFLAEVGPLLGATLEYEETLSRIAQAAVQDLADYCIVDVVEDDGEVHRLRVVSRDPSRAWVCDALMHVHLDRTQPHLVREALRTRRAVLMADLEPEDIEALSQSEEHLGALRATELRSVIAVPLLAHGELFGAIALVSSALSRVFGPVDVGMAVELVRRAAIVVEHARLYLAARRASQMRDEVLGIVAHDLRNPLAAILLQAQRLRRFGVDPRRPAEAIDRAATRMNRIIQDLLDVTQMEAGRLSIEPARIPTAQVVSDALEGQRPLAAPASLELQRDVAGDLPDVWADRDRLLQVFENLLGNALKFTMPGGRVTLGAAPREGEVLFWVADTGKGIAPDDLARVFDRFWQAPDAGRFGAGMGLPIAKGIVESHGGRIWMESTPGRGSTVYFTIPTAAPG